MKKLNKKSVIALVMAITQSICTFSALAAEIGVVQVFTTNTSSAKKTQELWENREFDTRRLENLDRGLIACMTSDGVFISWRWLGTESNTVKYNVYRDDKRVNAFPLNVTNFTDVQGTIDSKYSVSAIVDGQELERCEEVEVWAENKLEIPLTDPPIALNPDGTEKYMNEDGTGGKVVYRPAETSVYDLDNDGQLEIVLKWDPEDRQDNAISGITSPCILDAYELDGTRLWRVNLGYNIRTGSHYTQFMVYDLDGDGIAEMVCKTADGTTDSQGNIVGNKNKLWRNSAGYILEGPEYLSVFDASTGVLIDTTEYIPVRGNVEEWGDSYGNRVDRHLACVGYLDGGDANPSVIVCRGYYTRVALTAYDFIDKKLVKKWVFDTDRKNPDFMGQGNHSIAVADVDMDGKDEIIYGSAVIDDDGKGIYSTGLGHGDAQHTGDLIPSRPGLEIFGVHEDGDAEYGVEMHDARTGEIIWGSYENADVGRGVSADIDPRYPGAESWAQGKMIASTGEVIATKPSIAQNFLIYWDGDLGREIEDANYIAKWMPEQNKTQMIFSSKEFSTNNGSKASPGIVCDIFGDWREEVLWFKEDESSMAIFTTTEPTDYKIYSLLHDSHYRTYITTQNVGYNQPPHLGYYLGYDTTEIPVSRARVVSDGKTIVNPDLEKGTKYYPLDTLMRDESVAMLIGNPFAFANDKMMRIDADNIEVVPFVTEGRTLVPLRFISEAFGAEVNWNADKKEVAIKLNNTSIKLSAGALTYKINGKERTLDVAADIISDRVFVPLRAIAEALNKFVNYDKSGLIYISESEVMLNEEVIDILTGTITNYIEPETDTKEPVAISSEKLYGKQIPVYAVEATSDDGNMAEGAVDGSMDTRWNAFGDGEMLTVDLNEEMEIAAVAMAYFKGESRAYTFDIEVSSDGETWTKVLENQTSTMMMDELELQMFNFKAPVKGRYLRYVGHGNTHNDGNNIWELVILAP